MFSFFASLMHSLRLRFELISIVWNYWKENAQLVQTRHSCIHTVHEHNTGVLKSPHIFSWSRYKSGTQTNWRVIQISSSTKILVLGIMLPQAVRGGSVGLLALFLGSGVSLSPLLGYQPVRVPCNHKRPETLYVRKTAARVRMPCRSRSFVLTTANKYSLLLVW